MIAAAMSLTGCGGGEPQDANSQTDAMARAQAVRAADLQIKANAAAPAVLPTDPVRCSNMEWEDDFWSDATHTVLVGTLSCGQCFGFETRTGVTSDFITLAFELKCSNQ
jgi:hypothetical protein